MGLRADKTGRGAHNGGVDGHAGGGIEDSTRAQVEQHADEGVVQDADVEEHLRASTTAETSEGAILFRQVLPCLADTTQWMCTLGPSDLLVRIISRF